MRTVPRLFPRLVYLDLSIRVRLAQRTLEIAAVAFHYLSCLCTQKVVVLDHFRTKRYEGQPITWPVALLRWSWRR